MLKIDKNNTVLTYFFASLLTAAGAMTLQDWAILLGMIVAIATFIVNWYYKHKLVNKLTLKGYNKTQVKKILRTINE